MPGFLLHQGATVQCMHGGQAVPTMVSQNVTVSGMPITVQPNPYSISGCTLASVPSPPCVIANWVTAATKVYSNFMPVLLLDSQAVCAAPGSGVVVLQTQMKVNGM